MAKSRAAEITALRDKYIRINPGLAEDDLFGVVYHFAIKAASDNTGYSRAIGAIEEFVKEARG